MIDLISGGELIQSMKQLEGFQDKEIWSIMNQLAESLEALNLLNIVHRDIKPENILLTGNDKSLTDTQLILCDYGIASKTKNGNNQLKSGQYILTSAGSPGYIAPEVLIQSQNGVSERKFVLECSSDMYSLGILFYVLLSRALPWKKNSKEDIETQNMKSQIDFSTNNK